MRTCTPAHVRRIEPEGIFTPGNSDKDCRLSRAIDFAAYSGVKRSGRKLDPKKFSQIDSSDLARQQFLEELEQAIWPVLERLL
ncbi:hypothetical protein H7X65_00735 [Candidatus Parcubacteria bacterium]|nr:hypothetical protein [Candidatus Parcubacteria bacterium]